MEPNRAPHSFCFVGSCPSLTGPFVRYIVDHPKERQVTYSTFAKWVRTDELDELKRELGYGRDIGLALSTDWHVSFHRSELPSGAPCYYFVWSAMEYVFVPCGMHFDLDQETALAARKDSDEEDDEPLELPIMYRGARHGDPRVLRGPSYFSSAEVFAKTYGPTAAFRLRLERPLYVDDQQWYDFASSSHLPIDEIVRRVEAEGYDSVVNVRGAASGEPLYTVLVIDPASAQLVELEPNIRAGTGAEFDGQRVVVAYNLHNCRVGRAPRPDERCFTVRGSVSGRVLAHVDEILLEDVEFIVRESGLRRVRERGVREVFAFARGTARDPARAARGGRLGSFASWEGIAFNPFQDDSFVLRRDRGHPVWSARWVYFRDRRGIARDAMDNPRGEPIMDAADLDALVAEIGGEIG